ncbi:PAX-interacting protein [Fasciola hepatica]|uniref:PAX-interacting protein 1 n=1 Tax=Fasciola hepatica TaxID=6192 RepID=A0A4E0RVF7_FASHE|nr:PAX-interacting protein [Fasciola hepatica]
MPISHPTTGISHVPPTPSVATTLPGTNLQAATGISVQQICMNAAAAERHTYLGPHAEKSNRGAHSRGGGASGRGGASRRAQHERAHQQTPQHRFPTSTAARYVPPSPQRFPGNRPSTVGIPQRFPVNFPGVLDAPQSGVGNVGMITVPGSNMITGSDGFQLLNANNLNASNTVLMSHSNNPSMPNAGVTNPIGSTVSSTGNIGNNTGPTATGPGHHGPKSKAKSSKHAQEQNLNEEEKDAIVMQNVKNILSLQHTWNRDSHGRGGGTSSSDSNSNVATSSTASSASHIGGQSTIGNYTGSGAGNINLGGAQAQLVAGAHSSVGASGALGVGPGGSSGMGGTGVGVSGGPGTGTPRKPKSPKSPGRAGLNAQLTGGCTQSVQQRPASVQHFIPANNLGPHQSAVVSAAPAYIVQRHASGQLLASMSRPARQPQPANSQSATVSPGHYHQRPSGNVITAVNSGMNPSTLAVQQQQQQQVAANQRAFPQAQIQQPTLFVRTARHQSYPVNEAGEIISDVSMPVGEVNEIASVLVSAGPTNQLTPGAMAQAQPQSSYAPQQQQVQQVSQSPQGITAQQLLLQSAGNLVQVKSARTGPHPHQLVEQGNSAGRIPVTHSTGPHSAMLIPPHHQQQSQSIANKAPGADRMSPAQSTMRQTYIQSQQLPPQHQQQQLQVQQQQQKVQLSVAAPQYQVQGYGPSQQPQQIILQSPTGQQIIAHPQPVARGTVLSSGLTSGGMLLRSVGPQSGTVQSPNHPHMVSIPSGLQSVGTLPTHIMNGATATGSNIVFQASPMTPGAQTQLVHAQPCQAYATSPQHHKTVPMISQSLKPSGVVIQQPHQLQQQQHSHSMIRTGPGAIPGNHLFAGSPANTPGSYQPVSANGVPMNNSHHANVNHISPQNPAQLMRSGPPIAGAPVHAATYAPTQAIHLRATNQTASITPPPSVPVTMQPQPTSQQLQQPQPHPEHVQRGVTMGNATNANTPAGSGPALTTPAGPIPAVYYGHEGTPKPNRTEECLVGCVFLLLGYRSVGEAQRASWRRIIRSYGAQVVLTYDPTRVTHLVIDCQLEEPDVVKQVSGLVWSPLFNCLPVSDSFSTEPSASVSSRATSNQVIPASSPIPGPDNGQISYPVLSHHCCDPITCTYEERRRLSLLANTHALSYLPPFRPREHTSSAELRARRLCTYFYQHRRVAPAMIIQTKRADHQTHNSRARFREPRSYKIQLIRTHTRSYSQSSISDYPHVTDSDTNPRPVSYRSRSCTNYPINISTGSTIRPSSVSHTARLVNPSRSSLSSCTLEPSTDWSIGMLCARSSTRYSSSSSSSLVTLPHRVTESDVLPSPYVNMGDLSLTEAETSRNIPDKLIFSDLTSGQRPTGPYLSESDSSDLILPEPPAKSDVQSLTSEGSLDWPPTPLDLLPRSTSMLSLNSRPIKGKHCSICHPVVDILILPSSNLNQSSISATVVSPPTEIALTDSATIGPNWIASPQLDSTLEVQKQIAATRYPLPVRPRISVEHFRDRSREYTPNSGKSSNLTYGLNSRSNSPMPTTRQSMSCGDCVQTNPLCSPSSLLFDCKTYSRQTDSLPRQNPCVGFVTDVQQQQQSTQRRSGPKINTLRAPSLSAIYASISVRPTSMTRRSVHQRYSTSLDCIASPGVGPLCDWTQSRPELRTDATDSVCSRLFAIPDVSGLQKAVSCFGSPISPTALANWRKSDRGDRGGITGTHGRPTDRRLYCVLQRYPDSRAEMLQEVQRAHGQYYAFLVLHTPAWTNMLYLVRDLDRSYPHWQLTRQLQRSRKVFARAASRTRSTLGLNQIQPVLSQPALRDRVRVVTIFWVNDILAKGRMIPPYEILHLPSPFSPDITFSFIRAQLCGFYKASSKKLFYAINIITPPEGKKYEMAQLWEIPCVNLRWLQDLYFGDLMALASDLPHKYMSFERADVTTTLDVCTPRVQDLMVGWLTPIRLNQEIWLRFNKLASEFQEEERERKRKLELEASMHQKAKKAKCPLTPLNEKQLNLALVCRTRSEKLSGDVQSISELQQRWSRIRARYPPVTDSETVPGYLAELEALIACGVTPNSCPAESVINSVTCGVDEETRQSCTSTLSDASQEINLVTADGSNTTAVSEHNAIVSDTPSSVMPEAQKIEDAPVPADCSTAIPAPGGIPVEPVTQLSSTHESPDVSMSVIEVPTKISESPLRECRMSSESGAQGSAAEPVIINPTLESCISVKPEAYEPMQSDSGQNHLTRPFAFASNSFANGAPSPSIVAPNSCTLTKLKRPASVPYPANFDRSLPICRKRCNSGSSVSFRCKRPAITTLFEVGSSMTEIPRSSFSRTETISGTDNAVRPPGRESSMALVTDSEPIKFAEQLTTSLPAVAFKSAPPETPVKISPNSIGSNLQSIKSVPESVIRITFTAIDYDSRLSLIELCQQLPSCEIVEKAQDATHLICTRLLRTPKTYLALAVGCYLVTPKWIQASVLRGCWLDETPWLLSDPDSEAQLGCRLHESIERSRRRQMLGPEAALFAGLEFWLSPRACHREMCIELIKTCGGLVRPKRPTQKMALLSQPKQLIICHEDDSHVASYLMRIKTGNKAVHHEEFILSGVLRQELDFDAYQIQYVNTLQTGLRAAVAAAEAALANSGSHPMTTVLPAPTSLRFITAQSDNTNPVTVVASRRQNHPKLDPTIHNKSPVSSSMTSVTQSGVVCHATPCSPAQRPDSARTVQVPLPASNEEPNSLNSSLTTRIVNTVASTTTTCVHSYPPNNLIESQQTTRLPPEAYGPIHQDAVSVGYRNHISFPSHTPETVAHHPSPVAPPNVQHLHPVPSTGLQHLLIGSSGSVSVPNYMPSSYSFPRIDAHAELNNTVRLSLAQEFAITSSSMLVAYTTSTVMTNLSNAVCVSTPGSIMTIHDPSKTTVFVPSSSHLMPAASPLRIPSDAGRVTHPEVSLDVHKTVPRPRPSNLLLSGTANTLGPQLMNSATVSNISITTQPNQSIQRPVTALTAMIVAAEASSGDLVPSLPLGDSDVVVMGPVSSFVLPKPSGYHRPLNASSANVPQGGSGTSGGALNARSAAADAHAVATATAAAANALHSAEAKGMIVGLKTASGALPVPVSNLRSPCVYTSDVVVVETKKRIASGGSAVSGSSTSSSVLPNVNPLDDAVKSLINSQLNFQPLSAVEVRHSSTMESVPINPSDLGPSRSFSTSDIPTCFSFEDSVATSSVSQFSVVHSTHSPTPNTAAIPCMSSELLINSVRFDPISTVSGSRPSESLHPTIVSVDSNVPYYPPGSEVGDSYVVTATEPEMLATCSSGDPSYTAKSGTNVAAETVPNLSNANVANTVTLIVPTATITPVTSECLTAPVDITDTAPPTQSSIPHSTD